MAKLKALPDDAKEAMTTLGFTQAEARLFDDFQEAALVAVIGAWSLDLPLPTMDTVGDLDSAIFDAVAAATSRRAASLAAPLDTGPTPVEEPGNPTGRSGALNGHVSTNGSKSVPPSLSDTTNTVTAVSSPA